MKIIILFSLLLAFFSNVALAKERYSFKTSEQQQRFERLTHDMRCMVCQNESLATSASGFADDMRGEIYRMLLEGKSDREITKYMTGRYGYFVSFKPPLTWATYLLWFGPLILIVLAVLIWRSVQRKYSSFTLK